MDDLDVLARDFGFRPSGKSAPMRSDGGERSTTGRSSSSPFVDNHSHGGDDMLFNDVFGGPPKYTNSSNNTSSNSGFDYDSIFKSSTMTESRNKSTSLPVYDKPVYDDDIFDGLPGLKSISSSSARFDDDVFASMASPPKPEQIHDFDDLLGNLGKTVKSGKVDQKTKNKTSVEFDDLLSGLGTANSARNERPIPELNHPPETSGNLNQTASNVMDDPFGVLQSTSALGLFSDPLEEINTLRKSGNTKVDNSSFSAGVFNDLDPLNTFGKAEHAFSFNINNKEKYVSSKEGSASQAFADNEAVQKSSSRYSENSSQKASIDNSYFFEMPKGSQRSFGQKASSPSIEKSNLNATNPQAYTFPKSLEQVEPSDDVWLTVTEIPLFTQPTRAQPPSRAPPPIPRYGSKSETGPFASSARNKDNEFSSATSHMHGSQSPVSVHPAAKSSVTSVDSSIEEFEDFAMDRSRGSMDDENDNFHSGEEVNANSAATASAAAMKEAMDRAEPKFRHAKEVREREYAKATRSKESVQLERDEEVRETQERERKKQERLEHEQRQRQEEERRKRLEREKERAKEIERENARRAVERATKEARERAASEARERAAAEARMKAERAAVEKANAEARERAERAAVQRAQAEARERAAAEARERAERAAAEARERVNAETREKEAREKAAVARAEAEAHRRAERVAVEKAAAEARGRAAAEALERAAARSQQKNDNDLESFFSMGSQASSATKPGTKFSDPVSDLKSCSTGGPEGEKKPFSSCGSSSNMKKSSSTTNIVDDLSSIFGAAPSSGEFQEIEVESEERRRVRLERQQRTQERAAKALAEKNQRDLQTHREQEERHRIAEALDIEIKRWATGKEGNLRALLSTLQYVLWSECGWQPVSLTDLITGASVKKAYRKATLCIHPDKVQQKGANIQQKYIAEKVFDLLKEAWNKFNSEELF